jgi:hypothetical protein
MISKVVRAVPCSARRTATGAAPLLGREECWVRERASEGWYTIEAFDVCDPFRRGLTVWKLV